MIHRRPLSSERAPRSVVLSLALLLPLLSCAASADLARARAAGAAGFLTSPQRPAPVDRRSMDEPDWHGAGGGRSSLTASPILLSSAPKLQLVGWNGAVTAAATMMAVGRAGDGSRGQEQPQQEQRGLNWGAPSVTAGSSTVAAQHLQQQAQQQEGAAAASSSSSSSSSLSTADVMSLDSIRSTLIRQEDSIIFALIERAQFRRNAAIYARGILQLDPSVPDYDFSRTLSFLEYLLLETEKLHGKVRRYTSPEEHAFFPEHIPAPILAPLQFPQLLAANAVDVNPQILALYIEEIVPAICRPGDDEQHGSSVLADITLLQAISKRVHLGKFVAETKFQEAEAQYRELVANDDVDGVMELLTNRAVEERVLQRAKLKASTYGQDITGQSAECKVEPSVIAAIYRDIVIPLTKDVEVLYLFERVGRKPPTPLPAQRYRLRLEDKI